MTFASTFASVFQDLYARSSVAARVWSCAVKYEFRAGRTSRLTLISTSVIRMILGEPFLLNVLASRALISIPNGQKYW